MPHIHPQDGPNKFNNVGHMATIPPIKKATESEKKSVLGTVPGPMAQAAMQVYFERGSLEAIQTHRWRLISISMIVVTVLQSAALALLIPLKTVETIQINRDGQGRVAVANADAQRFTADDGVKQAWVIDWATDLTEINSATWQRSVERASSRSLGVAVDQIRDYLSRTENQPAQLLADKPSYIREFSRQTVNMIDTNVALIRYSLTSRSAPGAPKVVKSYAMTVTLATVKQYSREDVLRNPTGLAVQSFNISEELPK